MTNTERFSGYKVGESANVTLQQAADARCQKCNAWR
jgi:hypothetical protein